VNANIGEFSTMLSAGAACTDGAENIISIDIQAAKATIFQD
jgi:hypothetical protein